MIKPVRIGDSHGQPRDTAPAGVYPRLVVVSVTNVNPRDRPVVQREPQFVREREVEHPAHEEDGKNPTSIPIQSLEESIDLPDQVQHDLKKGSLRFFGVFSEKPLDVRTIESVVADDLKTIEVVSRLKRLNLPETGQHSFVVDVQ